MVLLRIVVRLLAGLAGVIVLSVTPRRAIEAEDSVLRRRLALVNERGTRQRRIDAATRASLASPSQWCDRRSCLVVVRPGTALRWHPAGWRVGRRGKSRPGRPPIPLELRQLVRRVAAERPLWGEERITNESLLKLGVRVSPRTVREDMPTRPHPCEKLGRLDRQPWADRARAAAAQPEGRCDLRRSDRDDST